MRRVGTRHAVNVIRVDLSASECSCEKWDVGEVWSSFCGRLAGGEGGWHSDAQLLSPALHELSKHSVARYVCDCNGREICVSRPYVCRPSWTQVKELSWVNNAVG